MSAEHSPPSHIPSSSVEAVSEPTVRQQRVLGQGTLEQTVVSPGRQALELGRELALTQSLLAMGHQSLQAAQGYLAAAGLLDPSRTDALPLAPAKEQLPSNEVVRRFERNGAVKEAPNFLDQVKDTSRQNQFEFYRAAKGPRSRPTKSTTESAGLIELHNFLTTYIENPGEMRTKQSTVLLDQAKGMLTDLTFLGKPEYAEAVEGLAANWKAYLDQDPNNQLCVLAEIGNFERYFRKEYKSDAYVRDRILATFSDEDLEKYSGRIVADINGIQVDPRHTRIILPDDRSLSGTQLREEVTTLSQNPDFKKYIDAGSVEINLIVGSEARVRDGLQIDSDNSQSQIPVKAYYVSHHSEASLYEHKGHVTDIESTGNYDFGLQCTQMAKRTGQRVPALAKIRPTYKNYHAPIIIKDGRLIHNPDVSSESSNG